MLFRSSSVLPRAPVSEGRQMVRLTSSIMPGLLELISDLVRFGEEQEGAHHLFDQMREPNFIQIFVIYFHNLLHICLSRFVVLFWKLLLLHVCL